MGVPLSDDEQRILRQIEEQLQSDERFAQNTSPAGMYRQSAKTVRWAGLGAIAGLIFTVVALIYVCLIVWTSDTSIFCCKVQAMVVQPSTAAVQSH
jgi:hypothetical protein